MRVMYEMTSHYVVKNRQEGEKGGGAQKCIHAQPNENAGFQQ
jgi:hypothetical protein